MTTTVPPYYQNYTQVNPFRIEQQLFPELETDVSKWLKFETEDVPTASPVSYNWGTHPSAQTYSNVPYGTTYGSNYTINCSPSPSAFPFLSPQSSGAYAMSVPTVYGGGIAAPIGTYPQQMIQAAQIALPPQMQQMNPQFFTLLSQLVKPSMNQMKDDGTDDKKRKRDRERTFVRRVRQTRPKVVEAKGAVQCKGTNRKRGVQCRNAALMEYIGPRPQYCAEHIELDPESLYEKCKSTYQKEPGDNKGCKEVVLKEFGICYKHFIDSVSSIVRDGDFVRARHNFKRISELLSQLEKEAAAAKKKDGDLFQRKNKLIPKFLEMKKLASKTIEELSARFPKEVSSSDMIDSQPKERPGIAIPIPKNEGISSVLQLNNASLPLMDLDLRSIELKHLTEGTLPFETPY